MMQRSEVLRCLYRNQQELHQRFGVKSLALFGSVARNEATVTSDIDLLVEFDQPVSYFQLFHLQDYLENLLGCKVDLVLRNAVVEDLRNIFYGVAIDISMASHCFSNYYREQKSNGTDANDIVSSLESLI